MNSFINLEEFLASHGRNIIGTNNKFNLYKPPKELGFGDDYSFHVLKYTGPDRYKDTLEKYIYLIAQIYNKNQNELLNIIENKLSVFTLRIEDSSTNLGSIDFGYFNAISGTMKNSLESAAHFTIRKEKQGIESIDDKAKFYINNCKMLQTEKGSFITKIGLPSELILSEGNLFSPENIIAEKVNDSFIKIIDNINQKFFSGNNPTIEDVAGDEFLRDIVIGDHGFQIIKNIRSVYEKSIGKSLDYKLFYRNSLKEDLVKTSIIKKSDVDHCKEIIKRIEDELQTETKEFSGYVYLAKTKNAKEDKKRIELTDTEFGNNVRISILLDSDRFSIAHKALGEHKKVRIVAEIKQIGKTYSSDYSKIIKFDIID